MVEYIIVDKVVEKLSGKQFTTFDALSLFGTASEPSGREMAQKLKRDDRIALVGKKRARMSYCGRKYINVWVVIRFAFP